MLSKIVLCLLALIVALLGSSLLGLFPQGPMAGFMSEAHAASVSPFADSEDFTFVAWVYWEGGPDWQRIFEFSRDAERNMYLTPSSNADTLRFAITASGDVNEQQLNASEPLPTDQWVHVAVTLAGDTGQLYLNGVSVDSGTITLNPNQVTGSQRWLAKSQYDWDPAFKGRLDEVAVFDRALSQNEIQEIMASGWDSLSGQTLALHMDENPATGGMRITDSSGQENYARLFTLDEENKSVPGKEGRALLFDGVNDYVALSPNPLVPDVDVQFAELQNNGDPLAFDLGVGDDPDNTRHYQGMARFTAADGTPYIILTRSGSHVMFGSVCSYLDCSDYPGELLIAQMGSRDKDGERLRSNRLGPEWMGDTAPDPADKAVMHFHFNGQEYWPKYSHPGGVQLVGDVLVVALEKRCSGVYEGSDQLGKCTENTYNTQDGAIALIDVADLIERGSLPPGETIIKDFYIPGTDTKVGPLDHELGVVGVTYVPERDRYLFIMAADATTSKLKFAWSDTADLKTTTRLELEAFEWLSKPLDDEGKWSGWQMLNFVRDTDTTLYLIGADGGDVGGDDKIGRYTVVPNMVDTNTYEFTIAYNDMKKLDLAHPGKGNLNAPSGVYVSPSGNLILYTGPHEEFWLGGKAYIEMGEFRYRDVYYPGTPPHATMCPWAELYDNTEGWAKDKMGRSVMYDFVDRHLDTWYNLDLEDFNDKTSAIRWYLKPGQILRLYEDINYGGEYCDPVGDGYVGNLSGCVPGGISSVFMGPFADPGGPYSGAEGSSIPLYGANRCYRDGEADLTWSWSPPPSLCTLSGGTNRQPILTCADNVSFQATLNVLDNSTPWPGGLDRSATSSTSVTFNNVAPLVTAMGIIDENRLATVSGTITDPGTLDTFNLTIDWGDGTVGPIPYPAGTTTYSATHQYQITTLEVHTVTVTVEDKDGGIGTASTTINLEGGEPIYLPLIIKDSQ